jgi:O-antigen ligase
LAALGVATVSIFLELAQLAGGEQSPFRFYTVTNNDVAVGFFANRNHFAAFLYVSMTLAAPWALDSGISFLEERRRKTIAPAQLAVFFIAITLTVLLGMSQILTRSRAGLSLALLSALWFAVLVISDPRNRWRKSSFVVLVASVAVIFLVSSEADLTRFADRLSFDPRTDARITIVDHTVEAIKSFMPFGTGLGSFRSVYATLETPADLFPYTFINAAHDDFLQIALETGVPGLIGIAVFTCIVLLRALELFLRRDAPDVTINLLVKRAALVAAVLLSLHSLVDYPLRTSADAVLFALCLGIAESRNGSRQDMSNAARPMRRRRTRVRIIEVEVIG